MVAKKITFLVYPEFQILDVTGPIAVFDAANLFAISKADLDEPIYDIVLVSENAGLVASSSGIVVDTQKLDRDKTDTFIVSGGLGTRKAVFNQALLDLIQHHSGKARRMCSVCSGSLILAATRLLDGKRATTHWGSAHYFERHFPEVRLVPDKIYTQDGHIWTSAGVTAGIDLALALVSEDCGEDIARQVAQELVVYYHRPGGQSQFSPLLDFSMHQGRFAELLSWVRNHLTKNLNVDALSERMSMSPRNFSRTFKAELGTTPAKAVERIRVDVARVSIEQSNNNLDRIALQTGFSDADHMRRSFVREIGIAPQALRQLAKQSTS